MAITFYEWSINIHVEVAKRTPAAFVGSRAIGVQDEASDYDVTIEGTPDDAIEWIDRLSEHGEAFVCEYENTDGELHSDQDDGFTAIRCMMKDDPLERSFNLIVDHHKRLDAWKTATEFCANHPRRSANRQSRVNVYAALLRFLYNPVHDDDHSDYAFEGIRT